MKQLTDLPFPDKIGIRYAKLIEFDTDYKLDEERIAPKGLKAQIWQTPDYGLIILNEPVNDKSIFVV